jgi:hypothetical protein
MKAEFSSNDLKDCTVSEPVRPQFDFTFCWVRAGGVPVLTTSHVMGAGSCRTEPRPSASRFLCAENSRSSFRSSSDRLWQYRTSLSWGGSWWSSCRTRYRSPTEFTYGTLSSGSAEKYTCTCGDNSRMRRGGKDPGQDGTPGMFRLA